MHPENLHLFHFWSHHDDNCKLTRFRSSFQDLLIGSALAHRLAFDVLARSEEGHLGWSPKNRSLAWILNKESPTAA